MPVSVIFRVLKTVGTELLSVESRGGPSVRLTDVVRSSEDDTRDMGGAGTGVGCGVREDELDSELA